MLAESRKSYTHGFVLTEAELRRFVDTIEEQFGKLPTSPHPEITFQLKYKNGVIADKASIEEVLSQENIGSSQIIRLKAKFKLEGDSEDILVSFEFIDVDSEEEPGLVAVRHLVRGDSRDWVFVTSAVLDERVAKIKRFFDIKLFKSRIPLLVFFFFLPLIVPLLFLLLDRFISPIPVDEKPSVKLENAWKNGEVKDPIEALVLLEKARDAKEPQPFKDTKPFLIFIAVILSILIVIWFFWKYYPLYNFCWGDYVEVFQRKESVRRFVLVVLLIGIVVSFIGGILANYIKLHT